MVKKFLSTAIAMIAISSAANAANGIFGEYPLTEEAQSAYVPPYGAQNFGADSQTAMYWLESPDADAQNFGADSQTAMYWLESPDADAQNLGADSQTAMYWLESPDADAQTAWVITFSDPVSVSADEQM